MKIKVLIVVFLVIPSISLYSQNIENWIETHQKVPVEKIFVHTNTEIYFAGDTVFFKVYLMDSRSGLLIPSSENIYVNLLDVSGNAVVQTILLSHQGQAAGNIIIPLTLKKGNYLLQAFTDFLQNFSPIAFFHKNIQVAKLEGPAQTSIRQTSQSQLAKDVNFYPEGGVLLANKQNLVAFKAVNGLGLGINSQGTVVDERGTIVTDFKSDYKGMGLFFFTPVAGKRYFAKIKGFPSFTYEFNAQKDKTKIRIINHTEREVILNLTDNSDNQLKKSWFLINMHHGEIIFYQSFLLENSEQVLRFDSNNLKPGINKLMLLDSELNTVSERYLFSDNLSLNKLKVSTKDVHKTNDKVEVQIEDDQSLEENEFSNLSVTVLPDYAMNGQSFSENFLTYLLLKSELSESTDLTPDIFNDSELSSEAKLRLLMLTCDSDSYLWNSVTEITNSLDFRQKAGIDLKGNVRNKLTGIPLENSAIVMAFQKNGEMTFVTQKTDNNGDFVFPGLLFSDTALIRLQAKTEKGNLNTEISVKPVMKKVIPPEQLLKASANISKIPDQLYKQKMQDKVTEKRRGNLQQRSRLKRKSYEKENRGGDDYFRLYETADQVIDVTGSGESYDNVIDFLTGKATGVDIYGDDISIRGAGSFSDNTTPLFLIDGVPVTTAPQIEYPEESGINPEEQKKINSRQTIQVVKSIPINDVEKIEILKSPQNLAAFGVKGANGVIAIYTQRGKSPQVTQTAKGILEMKLTGYSNYVEFYVPDYLNSKTNVSFSDTRIPLYWNPFIKTENRRTSFSFYTSPLAGNYRIFVEGITSNGKVCLGSTEFEVVN